MANSTILLAGLEEYHRRMEQHMSRLEQEYQELDKRWQAFSGVYEGNAAEQFRAGWRRTGDGFRVYVEQSQRIMRVLEGRIAALREANRAEGYM
jgi:uncharacterized protein YukE